MTPQHLLRLTRRWFSRAAADRVFAPLIADWQRDAAEAPSAFARTMAHVRGAVAFATNGMLVVARSAGPTTFHARGAVAAVMTTAFLLGMGQGLYRGLQGASDAAPMIAVLFALSMLPATAAGVTRRHRRYARAWRPLLVVTVFTVLAQVALLAQVWQPILAARPSPAPVPWVWPFHILTTSVLPGVLGIAMARACSRRTSAPSLVGLLGAIPILAWSDLLSPFAAPVPVTSAVLGVVLTVWTATVIRQEDAQRARLTRATRDRRPPSVPTGG